MADRWAVSFARLISMVMQVMYIHQVFHQRKRPLDRRKSLVAAEKTCQ